MTSKTKALKKGNYTPGNATPAPAKKAEKATNVASNNHFKRDARKEYEARSRTRRMRSMLKQGVPKEQIDEMFTKMDNRMILVLLNGSYTAEGDEGRCLRGLVAAKKYVDDNKLTLISSSKNAIWILSDKNSVDATVKKLQILGRTSITKPEIKAERKPKSKKPTNNTPEAKKAAKTARKASKKTSAEMRPYYAALRKGGINARIKKHNPTLAKKIEKWLKEKKAAEASRTKGTVEQRAKHRQLTSLEMKANKRARKAAKHLAAQERRIALQKKRMEKNEAARVKRTQKAQKPVQTEIKAAA